MEAQQPGAGFRDRSSLGISIGGVGSYANFGALETSTSDTSKVSSEVSSGSSLTAATNPAGLSIDQMLKSQSAGLQIASANAQTGVSLLQTADGALGQTSSILQQVRGLALQAANGSQDSSSLAAIGNQVNQSLAQLDSISSSTSFGTTNLLDGSQAGGLVFQTGASGGTANTTSVSLPATSSAALGLGGLASAIQNGGDLSSILSSIDNAASTVSSTQSDVGATTNALADTVSGLSASITNSMAASSGLSDVDAAQASTSLSSGRIKSQVAISLLAQANGLNQQRALQLLKTA